MGYDFQSVRFIIYDTFFFFFWFDLIDILIAVLIFFVSGLTLLRFSVYKNIYREFGISDA